MGALGRIKRLLCGDKYRESACETLQIVRDRCVRRFGDDPVVMYKQVGKRLQYYIDAVNNQGGTDAHRHALARWQIYKALYPEYISDEPPKKVDRIWLDPNLDHVSGRSPSPLP